MGLVGVFNRSALGVAAGITAFDLTGFRLKPFLKSLSSDQYLIGLQRIFLEGLQIKCLFPQHHIDPIDCKLLPQVVHGFFNFLLRSPASGTVFCCSSSSRCHFMTSVFISVFPTTG